MPVRIPTTLPARAILESENIFVMGEERASHQDIRPLRVAILNLMPTKIQTEIQLLRLLGNSSLQVDVTLMHTALHDSKNTPADHLLNHYSSFAQVRRRKFDGLIITGAPVEQLPFEDVDCWAELKDILDWAMENVYSNLFICWGAQAGLYHYFGIPKYPLDDKKFGVFSYRVLDTRSRLVRGFDDAFLAPHSRHTEIRCSDIEQNPQLTLLAESEEAGVYIVASRDGRHIFITGHSEYDPLTLKVEYDRDVQKGLPINIPSNYYPGDNLTLPPRVYWRSHAHLLFANWLNYYVYQVTPYHVKEIPSHGTYADF